MKAAPIRRVGTRFRILFDVVLAMHFVAGAAYWWLSPKGFPIDHSRFWLNSVVPFVVMVISVCGLVGMHRDRANIAVIAVLGVTVAWSAAAITGRVLFPVSLRVVWLVGPLIAVVGGACFVVHMPGRHVLLRFCLPSSAVFALLGVFVIWAQLPPSPSTTPFDERPPESASQAAEWAIDAAWLPAEGIRFQPAAAQLLMTRRSTIVSCAPMLDFRRISPDGFWSILAPPQDRRPTVRSHTYAAGIHTYRYSDGSTVVLPEPTSNDVVQMTSYTPVAQDTFTHLNAFCHIVVGGIEQLSLSFSPCGPEQIDVRPADYPTGRPARFAYLDASESFSVVEATSGEKGPFRTLAAGPLRRGEPLTIVVRDDGQPVASITLEDWSQQASTALSPTAGWRVPMNAIEFQRVDDRPSAPGSIWITLAATSVGRGWDTVGHRAGTYRNRVLLQLEPP